MNCPESALLLLALGMAIGALIMGLWMWFVREVPLHALVLYWQGRAEHFRKMAESPFSARQESLE